MPGSANPGARDHYVYVFHANGYPFYVGHGRSARLENRPIFVDSLVRLHPDRTYYKWALHGLVIADLWQAGLEVYFDQISANQTKDEAAAQEDDLLQELVRSGFLMANQVGNPDPRQRKEIVAAIRKSCKRWAFVNKRNYTPLNRYVRPIRSRSHQALSFVLSRGSMNGAEQDDSAPRGRGLAVPFPRKLVQRSKENMPESGILSKPLYNTVVVSTNKMTSGDFFPLVQKNAAKPIVLRDLIRLLIRIYRPPTSKKDPDMVIRIRTKDALTRLGYLRQVSQ